MSPADVILLAEDEDNDVFFITRAFQKACILNPIVRVKNGELALAYLEGTGAYADRAVHPLPVFVLLDNRMPRITGLEVIKKVRSHKHLQHLPMVVLTFTKESHEVEEALQAGANGCLLKPVSTEGIVEMLARVNLGLQVVCGRINKEVSK